MTDSTNTDDLDDEGTPMGQASPIVRLPFAESHKPAIMAGDKTATFRVDHHNFAAPGRTVELVATDDESARYSCPLCPFIAENERQRNIHTDQHPGLYPRGMVEI